MDKVVTVIGAGPGGMAATRALTAQGFKVRVFESQPSYGGVWNYTGNGPLYRDLNTNLQKHLMEFKDVHFPPELPTFVDRTDVLDYVQKYSSKVGKKADVHFNDPIVDLRKKDNVWVAKDKDNQEWQSEYVVIATGHCNTPYWPPIPGLEQAKKEKGFITHSRWFDNPSGFENKEVLIVGMASSGVDLCIQILGVTDKVAVSVRNLKDETESLFGNYVTFKPEIAKIDPATHEVTFTDGSSYTPDVILFCTGYLYAYPFLDEYNKTLKYPLLHDQRLRLCNLYKNTFYLADPTLAVVAMDKQIVPMPYSEHQAAVIARVWDGKLELPSKETMTDLEQAKVSKKGDGLGFHQLPSPEEVNFMKDLNEWAQEYPEGFTPESWGPEKLQDRLNTPKIKGQEIKRRLEDTIKERDSRNATKV